MKLPSIQFYPGDWLRDPVSGCSLAAQGLWLRLMILAHDSPRYGYLAINGEPIPPKVLAHRVGTTVDEFSTLIAELERAGVPERTPEGIIFSRRMVRDHKHRLQGRRYGKLGGNPALKRDNDSSPIEGVNPPGYPPPKMKEKRKKKSPRKEGTGERVEFADLIPDSLRVPKFLEAWSAWIEHRRERKPVYTRNAAERALPHLAKEGVEASVARIDRSICNGYQGLFFANEKTVIPSANGSHKAQTKQDAVMEALEGRRK